jgi:quercetin dioxygenase-like cupin family protein
MTRYWWPATALALATALAPEAMRAQPAEPIVVDMDGLEWVEIVPGVDFANVYGVFTETAHGKLARFDPGLTSPPHTHTGSYWGVVLRGTVTNPYQGAVDPPRMEVGDAWFVPGGVPHVTACVSEEPCLFYTHSDQAWDIEVVEW